MIGMSMLGKISTGMRNAASVPSSRMRSAATMKVYGRLSAMRTMASMDSLDQFGWLLQTHTFAGDLSRGHEAAVIAPGAALVVDDRGDVGIAQGRGKRRHGIRVGHTRDPRTLESRENDVDVLR